MELLTFYPTDRLSLANRFLGTFKETEPGFPCTLMSRMGIPDLLRMQGLHGELTCFTAMLTRTELMEPSMRTFSFSFLLMVTGCNRSSLLLLKTQCHKGLRTIKEQNDQGQPTVGPRITTWDQSPKNRRLTSRGAPKMGAREHALQGKEHRLWSQGKRFLNAASSVTCLGQVTLLESPFSSVKWLIPIPLARTEKDQNGSSIQQSAWHIAGALQMTALILVTISKPT